MRSLFRRRNKDSSPENPPSQTEEDHNDARTSAAEERSGLFQLHDCPSNQTHAVDIVAVHGLGGHWRHTWTGASNKNWLKDFLPLQLQDAGIISRVLSFGYDSNTAFTKAVTDIDDIAAMLLEGLDGERQSPEEKARPVIFIAHSLGGIVVKKAMILAHERSKYYGDLLHHIRAAVFFGVPHRGSDIAYWATFAANILQLGQLGLGTNAAYVKALQKNSPTFASLSNQFIERAVPLSIRTFYETERMGNQVIVDKDSAMLRLPNERAVGVVQSNHKTMCKFDNIDSQKYRPVWLAIKSLAESVLALGPDSVAAIPPRHGSIKPIFSVPFSQDKHFVQRSSISSQIDIGFGENHPVALCGLGGIGKSQIAIEYAHRYRKQHPQGHVLWVFAANETRFVQGYREIALQLRLPGCEDPQTDVCKLVYEWLNETNDVPWLMILDNADQAANFLPVEQQTVDETSTPSAHIAKYLPKKFSHSQFLLITTRSQDIGTHLSQGHPCVAVGPFSGPEAVDLLRFKIRVMDQFDTPEVKKLFGILGGIPLALTQAAAFISRNKLSVQRYVEDLEMDKQNVMDYLSSDLQDSRREPGYPNSVFRTWKLSFDQIQTDSPRAAELFSLMAMLDGQNIPEDILRKNGERTVDFRNAIGTLAGYSLINVEVGRETCAMHPLVQLSIQYVLKQSGQTAYYAGQALHMMAKKFPVGYVHENKVVCESLLPHALAVLQHDERSNETANPCAQLLHNVTWFELRQGSYNIARRNAQRAYEIRQSIFGDEGVDTMDSLSLLALVQHHLGKYEVAEDLNRTALAGREKILGMEHPDTLTSAQNLAETLKDLGKYRAAEKMSQRALTAREKVLGLEHPDTLDSVDTLAQIFQKQGRDKEAEELHRRTLVEREKVLGMEHPKTLVSVNNLALVLEAQGQCKAAEEMYGKALTGKEKVFGMEHPETLASLGNLAIVLRKQGQYEAAEEMNRRALAGKEKVFGMEHPDTLISMNNLAVILEEQGQYEAAEEMHRRALVGKEKVLGMEHPETLVSVNNLALVLEAQGQCKAAEEIYGKALTGKEKVLGMEHPDTLTTVHNLAVLLHGRRRYQEASVLYERALSGRRKHLGAKHPDTLRAERHYKSLLKDMDDEDWSTESSGADSGMEDAEASQKS